MAVLDFLCYFSIRNDYFYFYLYFIYFFIYLFFKKENIYFRIISPRSILVNLCQFWY